MSTRDASLPLAEALVRSHALALTQPERPPAAGTPAPAFTITISREAGARGKEVAAEVGRRLGWPAYDREILDKIAELAGRPRSRLDAADERPANWLEECFGSMGDKDYVSPAAYRRCLDRVVRHLGLAGRGVIVGRGANFLLPAETTLRVRLVARRGDREKVVARRLGVSAGEAAAWVETTDRQRQEFVKRSFIKEDVADPHHYDLVLNTSRLSAEEAAEVVVETLRRFERRSAPAGQADAARRRESPALT